MNRILTNVLSAAGIITAISLMLLGARAALSQEPSPPCTDRHIILAALAQPPIAEKPVWAGLNEKGQLNVITMNAETGTWSVLAMTAAGCTRVMSSGTAAQLHIEEPPA